MSDGTNDTSALLVITSTPPIIVGISNSPQPVLLNCGGSDTLQLTVSGDTTGHTFAWTGPGVDTSGDNVTSLKVSLPGEYYVVAGNSSGCPAKDSVAVVYANGINNIVTFTAPSSMCTGQAGSFTNTSTDLTGWTALWTLGDGHVSDSLSGTTHSYTSAGTFAVQLTMDSGGCIENSPVGHVPVHATPSAAISASGPTTFCSGNSVTLSTTSGLTNYQWSDSATVNAIDVSTSGNYSVTVSNQYGCSATSANTVVIVNPLPQVTLTALPGICNAGSDTLAGGSPAGGTYSGQWVSDGIFHADLASPGNFTITYSYTDANNCMNTATATLVVQNCTGIAETALDYLRIFPNPTGDVLNIDNTGHDALVADLADVSGKTVIHGLVITGTVQAIDLSEFSAGIYLLRLYDKSGNMKVVKVVKE